MNKPHDTVILTGGRARRMREVTAEHKLPKHLLSLGLECATSRLVRQMRPFTARILCIVNPDEQEIFETTLPSDVSVIPKPVSIKEFTPDLETILQHTTNDLVITTGDLVFSDEAVSQALDRMLNDDNSLHLVTDTREIRHNHTLPIRFTKVTRDILAKICEQNVHPESLKMVFLFFIRNLLTDILKGKVGISSIDTIANLNTPADYQRALKALKQ